MKVELDLSGKKILAMAIVAVIGIVIGYSLAIATGTEGMEKPGGTQTLTTADLNRSDIQTSILLSRFCEGMGLQSGVYWQQDAEGNVFGAPICLPPPQQ